MQTIKTAVVVVLLLGVCYGAYVALNAPEPVLTPDMGLEDWTLQQPDVSFGGSSGAVAVEVPPVTTPGTGADIAVSSPNLSSPALPTLSLPQGTPGRFVSNPASPGAEPAAEGPSVPLPSAGASLPAVDVPKLDMPKLELPKSSDSSAASVGSLTSTGLLKSESQDKDGSAPSGVTVPDLSLPKIDSPKTGGETLPNVAVELPKLSGTDSAATTATPAATAPALGTPPLPALPGGTTSVTSPATRSTAPGASSPGQTSAGPNTQPRKTFDIAKRDALKLAGEGKLKDALAEMSVFYNSPEITHEQQLDLLALLDALAAEVIYSKRHLLDSPYMVSAGETLESIAAKYRVSPELLSRINGLGDSRVVLVGTQLKTVTGPFRAEVSLNRGELTLFLGDLYAGRFSFEAGSDPAPYEGTFEIVEKRRDRTYYGLGGNVLKGDDPRNPYGGMWMSLGKDLCIHGTPEMASAETAKQGCISLAPLDANDVYMILAQGSSVTIRR